MGKKPTRSAKGGKPPAEPSSDPVAGNGGRSSTSRWSARRRTPLFEFDDSAAAQAPTPSGNGGGEPVSGEADGSDTESPPTGGTSVPERSSASGSRGRVEAEDLFESAKASASDGRVAEAIETYRSLVGLAPDHVRGRNNLGVLLDQGGSHHAALEQFTAAIELAPENAELLTNFGASLASVGRFDEAEVQLRKAARLDPSGIDVRANLGILYFRRGLYAEAELELSWVCERDPEHALAHFYRGESLNRLGRVDAALETLERAARLQPTKARIYYLLGILYDKKNMRPEAGLMYRKARELADR